MNKENATNVYFFLCENDYDLVKNLTSIEDFILHHPQLVWIWTTYFRLKQKGHAISLTCRMPEEGIVVISAVNLNLFQKPSEKVFLITTLADSPPPFYTQINISQNPWQHRNYPNLLRYPVWRHIAHWPQPNIVPRDERRGDRFEKIGFMGHRDQLEAYLSSTEFEQKLQKLGLTFEISETQFSDYSGFDAVLAIRDFENMPQLHKPYTKLINGWQAGVPVIAGNETAFQALKKSSLDFMSVATKNDLFEALQKLKADANLRAAMIKNGKARAPQFTEQRIVEQWEKLLFADAQMHYRNWMQKGTIGKSVFYMDLFVSRALRSVKNKLIARLA